MSKCRYIYCVDCNRKYCEFCHNGNKYEKKQNEKVEEDNNDE